MNTGYEHWNMLYEYSTNTGVGRLSLLQRLFPTQGLNPGLLHCRWSLYQLSYQGSPKNTGVDSLSLLQWIFLTQESNQGLLHCRWIRTILAPMTPHLCSPLVGGMVGRNEVSIQTDPILGMQ